MSSLPQSATTGNNASQVTIDALAQEFLKLRDAVNILMQQHNSRTAIQEGMEATVSGLTHELVTMHANSTDLTKRVATLEAQHAGITQNINAAIISASSSNNGGAAQLHQLSSRVAALEHHQLLQGAPTAKSVNPQPAVMVTPVFKPPTVGLAPQAPLPQNPNVIAHAFNGSAIMHQGFGVMP